MGFVRRICVLSGLSSTSCDEATARRIRSKSVVIDFILLKLANVSNGTPVFVCVCQFCVSSSPSLVLTSIWIFIDFLFEKAVFGQVGISKVELHLVLDLRDQ